jgi:sugar-specific transcriptional regulator TrmB
LELPFVQSPGFGDIPLVSLPFFLQHLLNKIGFDEKEKNIYLVLLKKGKATASEISEASGIERTLCYSILQKLIGKALVSYVFENNVKYFSSVEPKRLLEDLKEKEKELKDALPKLEELMLKKDGKTKAEIYQGKEGIKHILKDIVKVRKDYLVFGEEGRFQEVLPIETEQFMRKIETVGIKERVLAKEGVNILKSKNSKFKLVPKEYFSPSSTIVYGNKVAIFVFSDPLLVVLIENKDVAESYRSYFNLLWRQKF